MSCPCCAGRTEGQTWDLCDVCLEAALAGIYPHPCQRTWTKHDLDLLTGGDR